MNTCVDTHVRFSAWVYGQNTKFPNYRGNLKMKRFSMCVCTVFYLPCKVLFNEHVLFLYSLYNDAPFYSVFSSNILLLSLLRGSLLEIQRNPTIN